MRTYSAEDLIHRFTVERHADWTAALVRGLMAEADRNGQTLPRTYPLVVSNGDGTYSTDY